MAHDPACRYEVPAVNFDHPTNRNPRERTVSDYQWTIAIRPDAKRGIFHRVGDMRLTWHQADDLGHYVATLLPDAAVWAVPTRDAETNGFVQPEDIGNVLVPSGKRIRIAEDGGLPFVVMPTDLIDFAKYVATETRPTTVFSREKLSRANTLGMVSIPPVDVHPYAILQVTPAGWFALRSDERAAIVDAHHAAAIKHDALYEQPRRERERAMLAAPDESIWHGERFSAHATTDFDAAMAHERYGPWVGHARARAGILSMIAGEVERLESDNGRYDHTDSITRLNRIAAGFGDPSALRVVVDGLGFRIWTNDTDPTVTSRAPRPFSEADSSTWDESNLPAGYAWQERDTEGEYHLITPDGRDLSEALEQHVTTEHGSALDLIGSDEPYDYDAVEYPATGTVWRGTAMDAPDSIDCMVPRTDADVARDEAQREHDAVDAANAAEWAEQELRDEDRVNHPVAVRIGAVIEYAGMTYTVGQPTGDGRYQVAAHPFGSWVSDAMRSLPTATTLYPHAMTLPGWVSDVEHARELAYMHVRVEAARSELDEDALADAARTCLERPSHSAWYGDDELFVTRGLTISTHRDATILETCNFETIKDDVMLASELDGDVNDQPTADVIRASHWLVGWMDQLAVTVWADPERTRYTNAFVMVTAAALALAEYPIYDESAYSDAEFKASLAAWDAWLGSQARESVRDKLMAGTDDPSALTDDPDDWWRRTCYRSDDRSNDDLLRDAFYSSAAEAEWSEASSGGVDVVNYDDVITWIAEHVFMTPEFDDDDNPLPQPPHDPGQHMLDHDPSVYRDAGRCPWCGQPDYEHA